MSSISFAGCGFLMTYHAGVAMCLQQYAPELRFEKVCSTSGGLLIGVSLVCDIPLGAITTEILRIAIAARASTLGPFSPNFSLNKSLEEILRNHLPEDAHLRASGRLFVSVTRIYDKTNEIISEFQSREDLIKVILCGCFVPTYSGFFPHKYRGYRYMDGTVTNNLPIIDKDTITVSPFSGEADICPLDDTTQTMHLNVSNMVIDLSEENISRFLRVFLPKDPQTLIKLCEQGFDDTCRYLHQNKMTLQVRSFFVCSTFVVRSENKEQTVNDSDSITSEGSAIKSLTMLSNIESHLVRPVDCIVATMKTINGDTVENTGFRMNLPPLEEPENKSTFQKYLLHPISNLVTGKVTSVTKGILKRVNSRVNLKVIDGILKDKSSSDSDSINCDLLKTILRTTNEQQPFQAMYYIDSDNKVRVTEIFDITDCEDPTLQTCAEQELNQMLEFDVDWGDECDIGADFGGCTDFDEIFNSDLFPSSGSGKIIHEDLVDTEEKATDESDDEDVSSHVLSENALSALTRSYSLDF